MKKLFAFLMLCLFSVVVFAQTGQEIKPTDLPKTSTDYITKNFPGSTIGKVAKVDDPKKEITFVAIFMGADKMRYVLCFDNKGKFVKKGDVEIFRQYKITPAQRTTGGQSNPPKK
jgi:cell shape-determining protein MreC